MRSVRCMCIDTILTTTCSAGTIEITDFRHATGLWYVTFALVASLLLCLDLTCPCQFQIGHIVPYNADGWRRCTFKLIELLSTVAYPNCTRRRNGQPCDDAIPTGGQLIRVAQVAPVAEYSGDRPKKHLVWSSRSFAEGEYGDISSTLPFGPKQLR